MTKKMTSALAILLFAGLVGITRGQDFSMSDVKYNIGQTVQPAFEGWSRNPDGSFALWFGYLNRNYEETPDVEIGPDNGFGGGGEDLGQPSHFLVRRQKTVFKVTVPADWPKDKDVVWTLKTHGTALKAYGSLWPVWEIDPLDVSARPGREYGDPDNAPPKITSLSMMLTSGTMPPSGVKESCQPLMAPQLASVVTVANRAELAIPKRVSLPSMLPPACRFVACCAIVEG